MNGPNNCILLGILCPWNLSVNGMQITRVCPTRYWTRHFFNNFTTNEDTATKLGALQTHTTDTFLFISHTTNVLLLKLRCNIFIGVSIIKEMPGSVASGTHYISELCKFRLQWWIGLDIHYIQNSSYPILHNGQGPNHFCVYCTSTELWKLNQVTWHAAMHT